MKYFKDSCTDSGEWVKEEITKEQAIEVLSGYYNNAETLAETPCYYRTMFGGVDVLED